MVELSARIAPNWTSVAGALEGILAFLGAELPRHAIMGLTGYAWHFCLGAREHVLALPSGPTDLDRAAAVANFARTGWRFERYAATCGAVTEPCAERDRAIAWARTRLDQGRPLIGWDLHLHEYAIVYGYDAGRGGFLVDDVLTPEVGPFVPWEAWPELGEIELIAPVDPSDPDPIEAIAGALETAVAAFEGRDGPDDGQPRGIAGLDAWADALDGDAEIDRAGNAYTLAVLQAARLDAAMFVADLATSLPDLAAPFQQAEAALREETRALAPLLTLFPFPTGGHGNVANPGLRRAAAMALRRAAGHERHAADALREARDALGE